MNIDTHSFVKAFVNAKTDEQKAEAITKVFFYIRDSSNETIEEKFDKTRNELATKRDVKDVESLLRNDIDNVESSLRQEIKLLSANVDAKVAESKADILKWMFGMLAGQLTILVIILKLFFNGNV